MEVAQKIFTCSSSKIYKMKEVVVRTISGILYIAIILFAMFSSKEWFVGLFFILGIITLNEYLKLNHLKAYWIYPIFALLLYFINYTTYDSAFIYAYLAVILVVNLLLFRRLFNQKHIVPSPTKKTVNALFYIIGGFVSLTLIPQSIMGGGFNPYLIVSVFILMWANDTFAYLVGKRFGKNKLFERISPKKTIEGFIGGLFGALITGIVIFSLINEHLPSLGAWIGIAFIVSTFGTIGDLIQSQFKRQAGVKDSGIIMPGHGGMYDRLDSIIFASPFIYTFLLLIDYVS